MISMISLVLVSLLRAGFAAPLSGAPSSLFSLHSTKPTYIVPEGGMVIATETDFRLLDANGAIVLVEPKSSPTTSRTNDLETKQTGQSGVSFATWLNNDPSPIWNFAGTWVVPPLPDSDEGQGLAVVLGLQSVDIALATFLLYGAVEGIGGGPYWTVFSEFGGTGSSFATSPVNVSVGQTLTPILANPSGDGATYLAFFEGISGTQINAQSTEVLTAAEVGFEGLSIQDSTGFPSGTTETTVFSINTQLFDNAFPPVTWTAIDDNSFGLSASVLTDGNNNAQILFTYP